MDKREQLVYIKIELERYGICLDERQTEMLLSYYELLSEKNKVMNLTRIEGLEDTVKKHFADSLILERFVDINPKWRVLDLGSGAGLPGIPLAIRFPDLEVLSLDSVGKKLAFQKETAEQIGITRFHILHARAEDAARKKNLRESFDLVTARAVANLSTLAEYTLPFVRQGGYAAAYKGPDIEEELSAAGHAISLLGGKAEKVISYQIDELERTLILIKKIRPTPSAYPRRAGLPSNEPL